MILDAHGNPIQSDPPVKPMREIKEGVDFKITQWKTRPNYECLKCQFASLDIEQVSLHFQYEEAHGHRWAFPVPKTN